MGAPFSNIIPLDNRIHTYQYLSGDRICYIRVQFGDLCS